MAGSGVIVWQLQRRASARPLPEALADSLLTFHRGGVRQREALRSVWLWYIALIVTGITMFLCGRQIENGRWDPWAFGIATLLMVGVVLLNRYAARGLQRQIDALDQLNEETP